MIIRPERKEDYRAAEQMVRRAFYNRHVLRDSPDYLPKFNRIAEIDGNR